MKTVYETRDILLALSFYMEHGEHTSKRQAELQKLFEEIANDKIILTRKN